MMEIQTIIVFCMELMGTVAFAASGAMTGINCRMDVFGVCVLGVITAVGGGMTRDVILGNVPGALTRPVYVIAAMVTAVVVFAAVYFFRKSIPLRERLANGALLAALTASLLLSPLDKVWHLFQRPNWFPFRWSFLVSFFLAYLAVQAAPRLEGRTSRRLGAAALAILTVWELGYNAKSILGGLEGQFRSDSYRAYREDYAANAQLTAAARADAGKGFFRMGAAEDRGHNGPLAFGYPGITHYSSVYNTEVNDLLHGLGLAQAWFWCSGYGSTPVTDALFDIRYTLSPYEMPGYELLGEVRGLRLWKNPDVLPLAFLAQGEELDAVGAGPFERQNSLISSLLGEETVVFRPISDVAESWELGETSFTFVGTGEPVYADLSAEGMGDVLVNGETVLSLGRSEQMSIHYLCTPEAGEVCTVTVQYKGSWLGSLWALDQEELRAAVKELNGTEVTEVRKSGLVRLTAQADGSETLVTTIPAESGWSAYVDGQKVETDTWLNAFLALDLPAGEHQIELRYTTPGLAPGVILGCASVLALVGLEVLRRRKRA